MIQDKAGGMAYGFRANVGPPLCSLAGLDGDELAAPRLRHLDDGLLGFAAQQFGLKVETGPFRFLAGFFQGCISSHQLGFVNGALSPGRGWGCRMH
jgi:hypothetical protein